MPACSREHWLPAHTVLVAAGTSLQVYPVANMVPRAVQAGAKVIVVNGEPTKMDGLADAVLRGLLGEILPALLTEASSIR